MNPAMKFATPLSSRSMRGLAAAVLIVGFGGVAALAQSAPDTENGRYTLAPATDGMIRLDTRSGVASVCTDKGAGWACYAMPDERAALDEEIGRLQKDNESLKKDNDSLKAQLAQRQSTVTGKIDAPLPKADQLKKPEIKSSDGERKLEIPLPSDRDMDRVMAFIENAWRRLVDMANRVQKDVSGKI